MSGYGWAIWNDALAYSTKADCLSYSPLLGLLALSKKDSRMSRVFRLFKSGAQSRRKCGHGTTVIAKVVGLSSQDNWGQPIARIAIALAGYFAIPVPSFANFPD